MAAGIDGRSWRAVLTDDIDSGSRKRTMDGRRGGFGMNHVPCLFHRFFPPDSPYESCFYS
ncbi:MAG TPA: hypothetical protein DEB39_04800 [Planctomycetaceae bacterium]|nr:hypothetical protein [Planctomycetaceae bacterium]